MRSRRDFIKLVAAGSAAASLGRGTRALAATAAKSAPAKHAGAGKSAPARSAAISAELDKQKKSTADTLKTLRDHELSPSAPLAFVFKPLRPRKGGHAS